MDNLKIKKDMRRVDGTKKSNVGFLGQIKNNVTNNPMTEVSVQFDDVLGGSPIPLLVPTLSEGEIKTLQNMKIKGNANKIPKPILNKAINHAIIRDRHGLSPFYQDGE